MKKFEQIAAETHTTVENVRVAVHMAVKTDDGWACDGYLARTRQAAVEAYLARHVDAVELWADDYAAAADAYDAQNEYMDAETLAGISESDRWNVAFEDVELLRGDIAEQYRTCTLDKPVIIFARAGLWNGAADDIAVIEPDSIGDIIGGPAPYDGMDSSRYLVNEHDELMYVGTHHDGTNTAVFREWVGDDMPDDVGTLTSEDLHAHTRALGPDIRRVLGLAI